MTPMLPLHHRDKYIAGTEGLEPPVLRFPLINDELQINNILSK